MSPYEIGIMLWYYARVEDHPDMNRNPPVWRPTIDSFRGADLLKYSANPSELCYQITERGRAYVNALQSVPLPTSSWTIEWLK